MCVQNTAKFSSCCWKDISDSSVLNILHASMYASYFCPNAPAATVTLAMYFCCTAAMSQLEEKVKKLEFPLVEDADGGEYDEGTWSNAVAMAKARMPLTLLLLLLLLLLLPALLARHILWRASRARAALVCGRGMFCLVARGNDAYRVACGVGVVSLIPLGRFFGSLCLASLPNKAVLRC